MFKQKGKGKVYRLSISLHQRGKSQPYLKSVSEGFQMPQQVALNDILDEAKKAIETRWGGQDDKGRV